MDVALGMGFGVVRVQHKHVVKLFRALTAVFEHDAHSRIAVNIGVFTFDIAVARVGKSDFLIGLHEAGVHLTAPVALVSIENIGLGCCDVAVIHQNFFNHILDMLYIRYGNALDI